MESRTDAIHRYTGEEIAADRPDWQVRARQRADIDGVIHRHTMSRAEAHAAVGLRAGSLDHASLDTDALRQALDKLRAIPGGMADLSFALGYGT